MSKFIKFCFIIYLVINLIFLIPIINYLNIRNISINLSFDDSKAYNHIEKQLEIGYRIPGTEESRNCSNYFISEFHKINNNFTFKIHNFTVNTTQCRNILFKLNEHKNNIIIIATHYDTRARATKDDIDPNFPVIGANDGASSSAVLIELARVFNERKEDLSAQIWFLFFDAEDQGKDIDYGINGWDWSEGSKAFVNNISAFMDPQIEYIEAMILLDMVGAHNLHFVKERYSTYSLIDEIFEVGRQLGYSNEFLRYPNSQFIIDDHKPFIDIGIPSALLIDDFVHNDDWPWHHTSTDNISYISNYSLKATGRTIEQFIYNNYLTPYNNYYIGNFPWDNNPIIYNIESIILISIILFLIVMFIYYSRKYEKNLLKNLK